MKSNINALFSGLISPFAALLISGGLSFNADAALLNATQTGSFNMNLDRNALALAIGGTPSNPGHFLVHYYDTAESDYTTRSDSSIYFNNSLRTEIPAINLLHDITPSSARNPAGQASGRFVKSTTPNFALDTSTLTATGSLGMTGIELYKGLYNGTLIYGDYSLHYRPSYRAEVYDDFGITPAPSGWYLQNNVSFSVVVYELENLSLQFDDATNWQMTGDLLVSPENAGLLQISPLANFGDFCLGFGSYSGCGQISHVPLPTTAYLFVTGIAGLVRIGFYRRKCHDSNV